MKQILFSTFIYLLFTFTLVVTKLRTRTAGDLNLVNKLSEEAKDFKSNMNDLEKEEKHLKISTTNSQTEDISSGIKEVVKSLSEQFEEYKKSLEENSQIEVSKTESDKEKLHIGLNFDDKNYLDEIKRVTSDLSITVNALVKVDKNDDKKEEVQEKLNKIKGTKQKFQEAHEKIKYLRTLKENNNLLKENAENAKTVMGNLISLYNEYLSIEENLKNNLDVNLSDIKKDFEKSHNLLSNIDFFSILFKKVEKFYFMLEKASSMGEDKEKLEKFQKFISQTNELDILNKNLNEKIEQEIQKIKNISNQGDRLKSLQELLKISNVLKSLNVKVLELKDEVCKRMKISLESNLDKVADLIKNSNKDKIKNSSSLLNRSLNKISEEHKKAVDSVKSKILTNLNEVQELIKSNMKSFSENSLQDDKMGVGKTVVKNFSLIDMYFGELKSLNNSFDEKRKMKINKLLENAKSVLNQLKELAGNSKNILNILQKNNSNEKVIKDEYNNLVVKIENLKSNIQSNDIIDKKLIDEMNSQIKNYSEMFEYLKTGEVQTSIQKKTLKRLVNTNEALLQKMNINKLLEEIQQLEELKK